MEKDEIKWVCQYLNIPTEEKKISITYFPLLVLEGIACVLNYKNIGFDISISCAFIIFLSMFIWGEYIRVNSKFLFLYLGVEFSLWSLCCMLAVWGISGIGLWQGLIVFTTFLLFSILANIYLVKRNEGNIINGNSNRVADLPESIYGACGLMGMLACSIVLKFLSPDGKNLLGEMTAGILACLAQYVAIRTFYKHIIRMRYKIDEVLNQQKQKPKKKR
jgi:hypothetical protein